MTEMTATERATHDRIMAAPPAEESAEERVARAMHDDWHPDEDWAPVVDSVKGYYRRLARAAIAAMQGPDSSTAAVEQQARERAAAELEAAADGCDDPTMPDFSAAVRLRARAAALRGQA